MCSSPKSSANYRRHARKREFSQTQYEKYAHMVRRASACYEEAQQRKVERRQHTASLQPESNNKQREVSNDNEKT